MLANPSGLELVTGGSYRTRGADRGLQPGAMGPQVDGSEQAARTNNRRWDMPQAIPLITRTAALADGLNETFDQLAADGEICAAEVQVLHPMVDALDAMSTRAELAYQWGMAVLKGGVDGRRAMELEVENVRMKEVLEPKDAA